MRRILAVVPVVVVERLQRPLFLVAIAGKQRDARAGIEHIAVLRHAECRKLRAAAGQFKASRRGPGR